MQKVDQGHKSIIKFWRSIAFILLFAAISACDSFCGVTMECDCIEADDFGEYRQIMLTVEANGSAGGCKTDFSNINDTAAQGSGVRNCIYTEPAGPFTDSTDSSITYSSPKISTSTSSSSTTAGETTLSGCMGFDTNNGGIPIQIKCIADCKLTCQIDQLAGSGDEPGWNSTPKTFLITPNNEIRITASGSVNLSNDKTIGPFFVQPDNFYFHNRVSHSDSTEDVRDMAIGGKNAFSFRGEWKDGVDLGNDVIEDLGPGTRDNKSSDNGQKAIILNGVRRLVAYIDPHPPQYAYNPSASVADERVTGMPFEPDYNLWACAYASTGTNVNTNPTCTTTGYKAKYTNSLDDAIITSLYSISAANQDPNLGVIGGMIRWGSEDSSTSDNLIGFDQNPLIYKGDATVSPAIADVVLSNTVAFDNDNNPATADEADICGVGENHRCKDGGLWNEAFLNDQNSRLFFIGKRLWGVELETGGATTTAGGAVYENTNSYPVSVSFMNLDKGNSCNGANLSIRHNDDSGKQIFPERNTHSSTQIATDKITINNSNWSKGSDFFYLEEDDELLMWGDKAPYNLVTITGKLTGTATAIAPRQADIEIIYNQNDDGNLDAGSLNTITVAKVRASSIADLDATTVAYTLTAGNSNSASPALPYFKVDSATGNIQLMEAALREDTNGNTVFAGGVADDGVGLTDLININTKHCSEYYAYRVDKVHSITMQKSGMVDFTILGGVGAADSCTIKPRIVNPLGKRDGEDQQFYEYGEADEGFNLSNVARHPTNQIAVTTSWNSKEIFVRRGQQIRFNPKSWNGKWTNGSITQNERTCGIGMAMRIKPRLALLCRGKGYEDIKNPACSPIDNNGALVASGCAEFAKECATYLDPSDASSSGKTNYYCPTVKCQDATEAEYNRLNSLEPKECTEFTNDANGTPTATNNITFAQCSACKALKVTNSQAEETTPLIMDHCYDLEFYTGKVSSIPNRLANGAAEADIDKDKVQAAFSNRAAKIKLFDGKYGNFEKFSVGSANADGDVVYNYDTNVPIKVPGRLKFLVLDGSDFNQAEMPSDKDGIDSYINNNEPQGSGYYVNIKSKEQFFNGKMMEVKLCQDVWEVGAGGVGGSFKDKCSNALAKDIPEIADQPAVVKINHADKFTGSAINYQSHYQFNDYGKLVSIYDNPNASVDPIEDNLDTEDVDEGNMVDNGSEFYVHSQQDHDTEIRLTFKILDSDVPNCQIDPQSQTCSGATCTGIKRDNGFYVASDVNTGAFCPAGKSPGKVVGGNDCQSQYYCASVYANNSGSYRVQVKIKDLECGGNMQIASGKIVKAIASNRNANNCAGISNVVKAVINPVVEVLDGKRDGTTTGQAERVYTALIHNPTFKALVQIVFILAVSFYGIGYLMGVSQFSQGEIIARMVKISIIYLFIGADGWYWFDKIFVSFFKDGTDYLAFLMATSFDKSPEIQSALVSQNFQDKSILFSSIDSVFGIFFSNAAQKKIAALLFASIFGWAYLYIIYMGFMLYVYAVANAVLLYLTSQVFISILFVIGPIFFLFLFFNQTKEMFDKWLAQLIGFSLQQIFLLTTLAFFNMMMYEILRLALGFRVCWGNVWSINFPFKIELLDFWLIPAVSSQAASQSDFIAPDFNSGIPSIFSILFIWVIASLMKQFITFMTDLASNIAGGISSSGLSSGVQQAAQGVGKMAGKAGGAAWNATGKKAVNRVDKALFDSGATADKERKKREVTNKKDLSNRSEMVTAGRDAVSKHKAANMDDPSKLTQDALKEVEKNAQRAKGKELGVSNPDKLMANKGLKYEGENLIGAGLQAIRQAGSKGGSLVKSANDKKANEKVKRSHFKDAMKSHDAEGRRKISQNIESGAVKVDAKKTQKAGTALRKAAGALAAPLAAVAGTVAGLGNLARTRNISQSLRIAKDVAVGGTKAVIGKEALEGSKRKGNHDNQKRFAKQQENLANNLGKDEETSTTRSKDSIVGKMIGREKLGGKQAERNNLAKNMGSSASQEVRNTAIQSSQASGEAQRAAAAADAAKSSQAAKSAAGQGNNQAAAAVRDGNRNAKEHNKGSADLSMSASEMEDAADAAVSFEGAQNTNENKKDK